MKINNQFPLKGNGVSNSIETTALSRHRWYFYKEGFSPLLVQHAIDGFNDFNKTSDVIFDPFNGSGTVTLYSALSGYKSIGHEVNPFSSFISNCKQVEFTKKDYSDFGKQKSKLISNIKRGSKSPLAEFSTFSELSGKDKWLFNLPVLNAFEGGRKYLDSSVNPNTKKILKLALLNSIMENCNAKKDGKCLRYKSQWEELRYNKSSFIDSLENTLSNYFEDLSNSKIETKAKIINGDTRKLLDNPSLKFKLCITSPPYLNSFDYTDVYRPELFLGEFINSQEELITLRKQTLRSHAAVSASGLSNKKFGLLYDKIFSEIKTTQNTPWQKKIPTMIQGYFEDMELILLKLKKQAVKDAQLWIVVSNSAYNDIEIPVDLILADIGSKIGWKLKEIGVLRNIIKRASKYSPDIIYLRESVVIFTNSL